MIMTYEEALDLLFNRHPAYERQGDAGYKPGLAMSEALDAATGYPHRRFRCIHVAGTNGKGSVTSMIAAALMTAGYRVGLYTSPHLVDFAERIRVNGECIAHDDVVDFVERSLNFDLPGVPSFFELTTAMAFERFARCEVDYAVIEVGLGGRLDSTNIITPVLSVITNVSLEHTSLLGDTVEAIAGEKAGIIKTGVPVVVGRADDVVRGVVERIAAEHDAPLVIADEVDGFATADGELRTPWGALRCDLEGDWQYENMTTAVNALFAIHEQLGLQWEHVVRGFADVSALTGLQGRWMRITSEVCKHFDPWRSRRLGEVRVIADSAHNPDAMRRAMAQLERECTGAVHLVLGFMADKDVDTMLALLPRDKACYYCVQASTSRALPAVELYNKMQARGFVVDSGYARVGQAFDTALMRAGKGDIVYVGGSMYVLGEFLRSL